MSIAGSELIAQLNWRYAVKKFDATKKISGPEWATLEKALVLSASSYGLQPWRFMVVQDKELRQKLTPASYNQTQVNDCSHFVVIAGLRHVDEEYIGKFVRSVAQTRGIGVEALAGYQKTMIGDLVNGPRAKVIGEWAARQCYIAMGTLLTSAAMIGIDACPMEGLVPDEYDKILGLSGSSYHTLAAVACGYRSPEDGFSKMKKVRFEASDVVRTV